MEVVTSKVGQIDLALPVENVTVQVLPVENLHRAGHHTIQEIDGFKTRSNNLRKVLQPKPIVDAKVARPKRAKSLTRVCSVWTR